MGASLPQTPRCFLVLDYLFSSTRNCSSMLNLRLILETCKEISKNLISPSWILQNLANQQVWRGQPSRCCRRSGYPRHPTCFLRMERSTGILGKQEPKFSIRQGKCRQSGTSRLDQPSCHPTSVPISRRGFREGICCSQATRIQGNGGKNQYWWLCPSKQGQQRHHQWLWRYQYRPTGGGNSSGTRKISHWSWTEILNFHTQ